jgi:general secretion pathway protein I
MRAERGFTLIEVMIALVIFAVMAGAVAIANTQNLVAARLIQEQTEARWVNDVVLSQLRLGRMPDPGTRTERINFNDQQWRVDITITAVDMEVLGPFLRRVELKAFLPESDQSADVLTAVLGATTP